MRSIQLTGQSFDTYMTTSAKTSDVMLWYGTSISAKPAHTRTSRLHDNQPKAPPPAVHPQWYGQQYCTPLAGEGRTEQSIIVSIIPRAAQGANGRRPLGESPTLCIAVARAMWPRGRLWTWVRGRRCGAGRRVSHAVGSVQLSFGSAFGGEMRGINRTVRATLEIL